jgi:hypothetical protein
MSCSAKKVRYPFLGGKP